MADESYWTKLSLSLFDKVFLVILTGMIIFFLQERYRHEQKIHDEALANTKVYTDILLKQRENLIITMGKYFLLLEEIEPVGKAEGEQIKSLANLRKEVILISYALCPINAKIRGDCKPLVKALGKANQKLIGETSDPETIQKLSDEIQKNYMSFLQSLREITRETIEREMGLKQKKKPA